MAKFIPTPNSRLWSGTTQPPEIDAACRPTPPANEPVPAAPPLPRGRPDSPRPGSWLPGSWGDAF